MTTSEDTTALIVRLRSASAAALGYSRRARDKGRGIESASYEAEAELYGLAADRLAALTAPQDGDIRALAKRALDGLSDLDLNSESTREGTAWGSILREAKADLAAALDGAPEPEWEYGSALATDPDEATAHPDMETALKHITGWNESVARIKRMGRHTSGPARLVRRRKAGPWEPVGGETDGE